MGSKAAELAGVLRRLPNLASARLGAVAVACSDDFFAPMGRMLEEGEPRFIEGKYDDHGKWMDGWESRRKRVPGNDWCVVRLARAGVIGGVEVDTRHFTGNYPPEVSVEAGSFEGKVKFDGEEGGWREVVGRCGLRGDEVRGFGVDDGEVYTHVRVSIFPDGGIARLRVFGKPVVDWAEEARISKEKDGLVDLAAAMNGGVALGCNDEHFGAMGNLIAPGRGVNMGDGWETRRRREPGNDWVVIGLGTRGVIERVVVDTGHFKGNYPQGCSLQGGDFGGKEVGLEELLEGSGGWGEVLGRVELGADAVHEFLVRDCPKVTHVRLNIFPDGGVSRLRLFGRD